MTPREEERQLRAKLGRDFPTYAKIALFIRTKAGEIRKMELNGAQLRVHMLAEHQMRIHGKIRILLLKARQLGMSTYVEARFFWRVTHRSGVRAFILTHHADATANLFGMAKRFQENCPAPLVPDVGASSSRELSFPDIDSGYKVGTAGTEGIGRSDTFQYFHGSEVAFWPKAETHTAGALQAVPQAPGTEIWLESTANGLGGKFHEMWQDAQRGENEYLPIFLPWFEDPQYWTVAPHAFEPSAEESEYEKTYGLCLEQMVWRRNKLSELGSEWLFRQEYPATAEEAFQVSGEDTLIDSMMVMRARRCVVTDAVGGLVIGVDPADAGDASTAIIRRRGRRAYKSETHHGMAPMEVAGRVSLIIEEEKPDRVFIDKGGLGAGIYDRLREMGYGKVVVGVNFGSKAMQPERYFNLRAEMWGKTRDWLADEPADIPDNNSLHQDLCAPAYKYTSARQIKLEPKEDMAKRGLRSPDEGDALALTFAYPVRGEVKPRDRYKPEPARRTTWMSA